MSKYPMTFAIETPDGGGEARKEKQGEAWYITYPGGGLHYYGSAPSMKKEARERIRMEMGYAKDEPITFT